MLRFRRAGGILLSSFDIAVEPLRACSNPPGMPPGPTFDPSVGCPGFTFDCANESFVLIFEAERSFAADCSAPVGKPSTVPSEGVGELPLCPFGDEREAVTESSNSARNASISFFGNEASLPRSLFDPAVDTARPADLKVLVSTVSFDCADRLASFSFTADGGFCGIPFESGVGALGKLLVGEGSFPMDTAGGIAGDSLDVLAQRSADPHTSEEI